MKGHQRGSLFRGVSFRGTAAKLGVPDLNLGRLRPKIRKRTLALGALLALIGLAIAGWTILRQTAVLRQTLEAQLSERFGATVSIQNVEWDGWSTITAEGLTLRVPGWPSPADEVASIRRAVVVFKPSGLLTGTLELEDLEIEELTLRIIERAEAPGTFNLMALAPLNTSSGGVVQPRKALMSKLRLEMGLLRGESVRILATRQFTGSFDHVPDEPSLYSFALTETLTRDQPSAKEPVRLFGTWDERAFQYEATLDSLPVDGSAIAMLPMQVRAWARRAGLTGRIESARISGNASTPVSYAEMRVKDVSFSERDLVRTVPWARLDGQQVLPIYGEVAVQLKNGLITLRGGTLDITATDAHLRPGQSGSGAVEIPVELRLSMELLGNPKGALNWDAAEQWMADTIAAAPFEMRVHMAGVSAMPQAGGSNKPVELPESIILALRELGASDWMADVDVTVARGQPSTADDGALTPGPVSVKGRLTLSEGSFKYREFAYPITKVKGLLELDSQRVRVHNLAGSGGGKSQLRLDGWMDVTGSDPGFQFHVVGADVPVDDALLDCLHGAAARSFSKIFDRRAFESLKQAHVADDALRPGGTVGFDLTIAHARDAGERMTLTGGVDVAEAVVLLSSFPYPLRVKGALQIEDEAVHLAAGGMKAWTNSGGEGTITGKIEMPRTPTGREILTHLRFDFHDEHFSPLLLAAIPPSFTGNAAETPGWPGRTRAPVADLLAALGAKGTLRIAGSVDTQGDGNDRVLATVNIADGSVEPSARLPRVLRKFNLSWPAQMSLHEVTGTMELSSEGLDVVRIEARREGGRAVARGHFAADGRDGSLHVNVVNFPLTRDLIGVAEGQDLSAAYRAWDALQPTGTFDGSVEWHKDAAGASTEARAQLATLMLGGTQPLTPEHGEFTYRDGTVTVHDVVLRAKGARENDVVLKANGVVVGEKPDFTATVTGGYAASPIVGAALLAGGLSGVADTIAAWNIDGDFDARLSMGAAAGGAPWRMHVAPSWISGVHAGNPFMLKVESGGVEATEAGVVFRELRASAMDGWLGLDGSITTAASGATHGDLTLSALLARWASDVHALLPDAARESLEAIDFNATGPVSTDALRIQFTIPASEAASVSVDGRLGIVNGSFRAGTPFTNADGHLDFALATRSGTPGGHIDLGFSRLLVVEREATDVSARLVFDSSGDEVTMENLEGQMYGGRVSGRARALLGQSYSAAISFANVRFAPFAEAADTPEQKMEMRRARDGKEGPGRMRGQFQLSGAFGKPDLQRGTGRVAVADARMMEFPLGMSILQLSQLMLPLNASLERADAEFQIVGDVLTFEHFVLASSTLRLEGSGSLSLSDGDLALRFRNRGTVPIWSDLFGAVVSDSVFMIDVQGTLKAPEPRLVPIPILAPEPSLPPSTHASRMTQHSHE